MRIIATESKRSGWAVGLALAGVVLFALHARPGAPNAQGEIRETPRPQAFQSGGERSETILREIADTLKRIDGRLERFEQALREGENQAGGQRSAAADPALPPAAAIDPGAAAPSVSP